MFYRILYQYPDFATVEFILPTINKVLVESFLSLENFEKVDEHWWIREDGTKATYSFDANGTIYPPIVENE